MLSTAIKALKAALVILAVYAAAWVFGNHEMTYYLGPATRVYVSEWTCPDGQGEGKNCYTKPAEHVVEKWVCKPGEEGPFEGENFKPYECHIPATTCPLLWFPLASESPCPYHDPLGD